MGSAKRKRRVGLNRITKVAHHDAGAQCGPHVDVRDARVDMHPYGLSIVYENLLEEHPVDLARLDERVGHKVAFRAVGVRPTETEAFLLCGPGLNEDVPCARYLCLNPPAECLRAECQHRGAECKMERTAMVSQTSA